MSATGREERAQAMLTAARRRDAYDAKAHARSHLARQITMNLPDVAETLVRLEEYTPRGATDAVREAIAYAAIIATHIGELPAAESGLPDTVHDLSAVEAAKLLLAGGCSGWGAPRPVEMVESLLEMLDREGLTVVRKP